MLTQFLASVNVKNGSEIWLGGRQMDFHNFNWGDGSLFNYSYWEHGEPNFPAEKCIEMSWRNGRWNDINCRLKRAVLCERQVSNTRQRIKPNLYQPTTCLESNCTTPTSLGQNGLTETVNSEADLHPGNSSVTSVDSTNSTSQPNATLAVPDSLLLPMDDKPTKVITSIMQREQPTIEPFFLFNHTVEPSNNSTPTFIHYNLPPPSQPVFPQPVPPETGLNSRDTPIVVEPIATDPKLAGPSVSQQVFDSPLTLLDKLKPTVAILTATNTSLGSNSSATLSTLIQ